MTRHFHPPLLPLATLLLLLASGCATPGATRLAPAPAPASALAPDPVTIVAAARLEDTLPIDPAVVHGRLTNGLSYLLRHNAEPQGRVDLWLVVNAGSVLEDEDQQGLAHFVEHMAFNGTRRFERQEMVRYLESIGMRFGPDLNAYTSFDQTVYQLRLPTDSPRPLETALDIFEDWLTGITFDPEEVDKERGVLVEEWRLGRGAEARLADLQDPILFAGSRYAERLVIGDEASLTGSSREALVRFYRDWYRPDLAAIIAVGDIDPHRLATMIEERFRKLPRPENPRPRQLFPLPDHLETLVSVATDPEATRTSVAVYYKHPRRPEGTFGDYRGTLVSALYDHMLNSRLGELAQAPQAPFLFGAAASGNLVRTADLYYQVAGVAPDRVTAGLAALVREAERVDRHGFTPGELARAKKDLLRSFEQASEQRETMSSRSFTAEYSRHFLDGEPIPGVAMEVAIARRFVPEITLAEVNRAAQEWISENNRVILVSGPREDQDRLPTAAELLEVFEAVQAEEIAPYEDQVREGPLVAEPPVPGPVVEEETIPEIGVTRWRLANGARVVLKPTDFKQDEVLFAGISPGGTSLVSERDDVSASLATALVGEGGLGPFSVVELEKALAGTRAGVSPFLGELDEGVRGAASTADLPTLFELVYLTFTAPRFDPQAARTYLARIGAYVDNRLADPAAVYQDRLSQVLTQEHPRRRPLSRELLAEADIERAFSIYQERFADASDFTFFLVGSFDLATVRPLVESYLGSLPAAGKQETWKDVGVRRPEGSERFEVRRGLEPKSQVTLIYTSEVPWSRENVHQISSLADVLRQRLRGVLREELGGTYGVGVGGNLSDRPQEIASVSIGFGCAPENVEELVAAVFAEVDRLRTEGPDEATVAQVREAQLRQRELQLRDNVFWLAVLRNYEERGEDPRLVLAFDDLVAAVTPESIREAARIFLPTDRHVLGILMPENDPPPQKGAP